MSDGLMVIGPWRLAAGYLLLLIPLGIMMWYKINLIGKTLIGIVRMTVQLLFVGFYLQVVFKANNVWLTLAWLVIMISVADISVIRHCNLRVSRFVLPLYLSLFVGTAVPVVFFVGLILTEPTLLEAQYVIPIGGMVLGNCLRADVIGLAGFYNSIKDNEKSFLQSLAYGASVYEAVEPYFRKSFRMALLPTITMMSTVGLVSLPGMMTGVILAGASPVNAIAYQIAIMISIFTGTSITIVMVILLTVRKCFDEYGLLKKDIFA